MKILAFNGSPRPGGNTETLLAEALKPLREAGHDITVFNLNGMKIKPCQDCGSCATTGICIHKDEMQQVFDKIREAERVILASPIFFFGISAQAKAMVDRCQAFWCEKYLLKKTIPEGPNGRRGLLLLVGGMKKDAGGDCAKSTATAFFRTISVPTHETLYYSGVDAKGDILRHPTALADAREAGRLLSLLNSA